MVLRKPVAAGSNVARQNHNPFAAPYPVTPTSPDDTLTGRSQHVFRSNEDWTNRPESHDTVSSMSEWDQELMHGGPNGSVLNGDMPSPLRNGETTTKQKLPREPNLPPSLRVGPTDGTPRSSFDSQRSAGSGFQTQQPLGHIQDMQGDTTADMHSNNPYFRMNKMQNALPDASPLDHRESTNNVWAELEATPAHPAHSPPPPPQHELSIIDTEDTSLSWETQAASPARQSELIPVTPKEPNLGSLPLLPKTDINGISYQTFLTEADTHENQERRQIVSQTPLAPQSPISQLQDFGSGPSEPFDPPQYHAKNTEDNLPPLPLRPSEEAPPLLPPRRSQDHDELPPPQPSRPAGVPSVGNDQADWPLPRAPSETQRQKAIKQRSETYQTRLINWTDSSSTKIRQSPIMVQNANGPCPLLALVNALTLSTPADINTALVETLRVREQVSLGLLLDAVIDELMSGRRGDAAQNLPDVSELYAFLVNLHTGMNVNPRFVGSELKPVNLMDASVTDLPRAVQDSHQAGGFEETREMRLYSTFAIPLVHGWIPPQNDRTYKALARSAMTYEDAQNLLFHEEELEEKLQRQELDQSEQLLLEDIAAIKYFLSSSATQLTRYGLESITEALPLGEVAILFRNDHFSTLYRHPRSGQLLTLVTDMGYAGHDEVVWESLVDVGGQGSEFFSGDFRPVGNASDDQRQTNSVTSPDDLGWTTVSRSRNQNRTQESVFSPSDQRLTSGTFHSPIATDGTTDVPILSNTEQEDHDLALAMQLQEEEEDRQRQENAARRREEELSRAYLSSPPNSSRRGPGGGGVGGTDGRAQTGRPIVVPPRGGSVRRDPEAGDDAPPPSYEQAAKGPAYHPPTHHSAYPNAPFSPNGGPSRPLTGSGRQASAYSQTSINHGIIPTLSRDDRRRSSRGGRGAWDATAGVTRTQCVGGNGTSSEESVARKDERCVMM